MIKRDLGGNRLGSGGKNEIVMHGYERSNHDLQYVWKSSISAGTLVPFMSEVGLPGDSFTVKLNAEVLTLPTIGPLFGSYKVQLDVFQVPLRLYNKKLKMNALGIGLEMDKVYLPQIELRADGENATDLGQINKSSIFNHLGIAGLGFGEGEIFRRFNACDYLAYFDIFKQYYANKMEDRAYIIHNPMSDNEGDIEDFTVNDGSGELGIMNSTITNQNWEITDPETLMFRVTFTNGGLDPDYVQIQVKNVATGVYDIIFLKDYFNFITTGTGEIRYEEPTQEFIDTYLNVTWEMVTLRYLRLDNPNNNLDFPRLESFELKNIDKMREDIMGASGDTPFIINEDSIEPYCLPMKNGGLGYSKLSKQEGLLVKTYQSDLFNNWINTEIIDGDNGINAIASIDTSSGSFTIDTLNITKKVYEMLSRIGASGGTYDDYISVIYDHERFRNVENPVYMGGLSKELVFEEVISQSQTSEQPLGTLAGRGRMTNKHKGGHIEIKCDEPCIIMGIVSLTPRICYSQGNKWDKNLKTLADFHKPHLSGIGFQDLITDQMAYWDTWIDGGGEPHYRSAGKVPAWINYMTNVDVAKGNFAEENDSMFMTLNRDYSKVENGNTIQDLTTYIDPSKFNNIFADTRLDAMNFWSLINVDLFARRKMSAKQIPNL